MMRTIVGCASVAAAALMMGSVPTLAHEQDTICNAVLDSDGSAVLSSTGNVVLHSGSTACPDEVASTELLDTEPDQEIGELVALPNDGVVYFSLDSDELSAEDEAVLADIVAVLQAQEAASVSVAGHADRSGSAAYNMELSERRADSIAEQIIGSGIPEASVSTEALGESEPAIETEDGVVMQQNRRAVIDYNL